METNMKMERTPALKLGRTTLLLSAAGLVTMLLTIVFELTETQLGVYIFKPLTTILITVVALVALAPPSVRYKRAVVLGLLFSLLGDILLMVPGDLFLFGLVSFLIAHLLYISAFVSIGGWFRTLVGALPFAIVAVVLGIVLWPDLGEMRVPALVYMVVILIMAWQAFGQWRQTGQTRALLAFTGAILFVISDLSLAVNRFVTPIELSAILVLGTYYPAQWLIALSAGNKQP